MVAIEIALPDSGFFEFNDTLHPVARPLNGRGDSVAATVYWATLDTAIVAVLDSETGATLGKQPGAGRIQARVGRLVSAPVTLVVRAPLDSLRAASDVRDTVTVDAPGQPRDTLSDSLTIRVFAEKPDALTEAQNLLRRRLTFVLVVFPDAGRTVTLLPNDTVFTDAGGRGVVRVRLDAGAPPDSVVVTARSARHDGTLVDPDSLKFVVEFRP